MEVGAELEEIGYWKMNFSQISFLFIIYSTWGELIF